MSSFMNNNNYTIDAEPVTATPDILAQQQQQARQPSIHIGYIAWHYYTFTALSYGTFVFAFLGFTANIINMVVFYRQGIKDGVTLSLFTLAVSDFMLCFILLGNLIFEIMNEFDPGNVLHPRSIQFVVFGFPRTGAYCYSTCITIYLSLERSLCVLMPFKFKSMFTRRRTVAICLLLAVFAVGATVPAFFTQGLTWRFDPRYNKMRLFIYIKQNKAVRVVFLALTSVFIPIVSQVTIAVTTALMIYGLRGAKRFMDTVRSRPSASSDSKSDRLSSREKKVVTMVLTLSIVFLVCNFPFIMGALLQYSMPNFKMGGLLHHYFEVVYALIAFSSAVNGSVNVAVYYHHSTRFKQVFNQVFCRKQEEEEKAN